MKPRKGSKRPSNRIKQPLRTVELAPRRSRHGKEIVMQADYLKDPGAFDLNEVGIRKSNTLRVASGPTIKKGKLNGGAGEPEWWKQV